MATVPVQWIGFCVIVCMWVLLIYAPHSQKYMNYRRIWFNFSSMWLTTSEWIWRSETNSWRATRSLYSWFWILLGCLQMNTCTYAHVRNRSWRAQHIHTNFNIDIYIYIYSTHNDADGWWFCCLRFCHNNCLFDIFDFFQILDAFTN